MKIKSIVYETEAGATQEEKCCVCYVEFTDGSVYEGFEFYDEPASEELIFGQLYMKSIKKTALDDAMQKCMNFLVNEYKACA